MRLRHAVLAVAFAFAPDARAQACADLAPYEKARAIVADLGRITAPGGIQRLYAHPVGGIDQWISIRGQDRANPAILFVHGGPASPLMPTQWQFQRPLEEFFTMVTYDQRAAGKTHARSARPDAEVRATLDIERYVDDAIEVAEHVRGTLGQDRLILMGHSWGTIVGLRAALKRPDLFHAYVGIGQVIDVRENERLSWLHGLEQARKQGNAKAIAELESIAPYPGDAPLTRERIVIARTWAQHYGGLSAFRSDSPYFFRAGYLAPEYADRDVCAIDAGNVLTLDRVLPEFLRVDFTGVTRLPIPVVMLMGRHDYTTPSAPTAAWLARVQAPAKRGVWFERSAHMIPWEEPGKLLVSLLTHARPLAAGEGGDAAAGAAPSD